MRGMTTSGMLLERIRLGHHVTIAFTEQDIDGNMLLELDQEILEELEVTK